MSLENYTPTSATVFGLQTACTSFRDLVEGNPKFSVCLCDDNSAFLKDLSNPNQKTTLYPPPSAQVITKVCYSILLQKLIVFLANWTCCQYRPQKEVALLESMLEPKDILDAEHKRAITQDITFMDVIVTRHKRDIRCMDADLINQRIHIISQVAALSNTQPHQEFVVIGLGKGAVILMHMWQLNKLFLRLTVHKEAVLCVRFLTKSALFISICSENYLKIWRPCRRTVKPEVLCDFRLKSDKKLQSIMLM